MKEEILKITPEQAQSLWAENGDGTVHTQSNGTPGMFLGFDRDSASLLKEMKEADQIQIGGPNCMAMGHGIVVFPKGAEYHRDLIFVQHDAEKMKAFLTTDANV